MGLDMYLYRMPRYKDTTPDKIEALENYLDWKTDPKAQKYTLKEWCGVNYSDVPKGNVKDFYSKFLETRYFAWDDEKKYPYRSIMEQVGYWRKANQIHNWFVKNVQDGVDDCGYHHEVTKEVLETLLDVCKRVIDSCELIDGKIFNGYGFENGKRIPIINDGKYIKDYSVAQELLPSCSGFFFGGTDYDEYYVRYIKDTIYTVTKVIETTNFDTQMIYYCSSW